MRNGRQITQQKINSLIEIVTEKEIMQALKDNGDFKAPDMNGPGVRFFKATRNIVKQDFIAMTNFFVNEKMYSAINITLVTLITRSIELVMDFFQ